MIQNERHNILILKTLLVFMAVLYFLVSCTQDESKSHDRIQPITFTTPIIDGITRAQILDKEQRNPYDEHETFRVFGIKYTKNTPLNSLFSDEYLEYDAAGEVVKKIEGTNYWNTETSHFWSSDDKYYYAFRAYSPSDIECARYDSDDTGLKLDNYVTPDIGKQYDLLYAPAIYDLHGINSIENMHSGIYTRVNIIFMHALTPIHFRVHVHPRYIKDFKEEERDLEASRYTIRQITLSNVYNSACFDEKAYAGKDQNGKTINICSSSNKSELWTKHNINNKTTNSYNFVDASSPIKGIGYSESAEDIQTINNKAHMAFMIPQVLPDNIKITVQWEYNGKKGLKKHTTEFNHDDITEAAKNSWIMGRRYVYNLSLWGDTLQLVPSTENIIENADRIN